MAPSSDDLTPIAVVDDYDVGFLMTGIYPDDARAIFREMVNGSYGQTLTHITTSSWSGSYIFDGRYTRIAVYICLPPAAADSSQAAFASYTIDGTLQSTSYVPFTNSSLFIPRFAHFSSGLLLAIPDGHHNLTIQVSADPSHPYLFDYVVLWDKYLGPDHPYPGSPTYVSTLSPSSPTSVVSTAAEEPGTSSAALSLSGPTALASSTASAPVDTLPSASSAPPPSSPAAPHIAGAVLGSVAAGAALLAVSYAMYRRHRRHGRGVPVSPNDGPDDPRSTDSQPLMAEADAPPVVVGPLRASESHPYDVPTDTAEGLYTTLVRHQTGRGKIKEIRLQPSQTSFDASLDLEPGTSASSSVLFKDASSENLPLYSSSSAQASQTVE